MPVIAPSLQPAIANVESDLRGFVQRDLAQQRRMSETPPDSSEQIKTFVQGLSGGAIADVERTINELSKVRDMLRNESDRVIREVNSYASLAQAASSSMKVISDGLSQWQAKGPNTNRR